LGVGDEDNEEDYQTGAFGSAAATAQAGSAALRQRQKFSFHE
jgi:hypothetical protein